MRVKQKRSVLNENGGLLLARTNQNDICAAIHSFHRNLVGISKTKHADDATTFCVHCLCFVASTGCMKCICSVFLSCFVISGFSTQLLRKDKTQIRLEQRTCGVADIPY